MDLNDFAIFRMMSGKMRWLGQRQRVLAENIANADTPKYQARELKQVDFRKSGPLNAFRVQLARTHDGHIKGVGGDNEFVRQKLRKPYEVAPTGNSVVLEEQVLKWETAGDHRDDQPYRKHIAMFKMALDRGGRYRYQNVNLIRRLVMPSDLKTSMFVAASGMRAQGARIRTISENVANANSGPEKPGGEPYRRRRLHSKTCLIVLGRTVKVSRLKEDKSDLDFITIRTIRRGQDAT